MTASYGIIGCGMMGQEHLRTIALLPESRVAAIFEPDPGMRKAASTAVPDALMVDSIEALLAVEAVNCLLIASPNYLHRQQIEAIKSPNRLNKLAVRLLSAHSLEELGLA